jgi:transcriptional regulator with XRE-family HTH domain
MIRLSPIDKARIGMRLTAARDNAGLSQPQVARACGVHINSVQKWEKGFSFPTEAEARATLAALYGVDEVVLFAEYEAAVEANRALLRPA